MHTLFRSDFFKLEMLTSILKNACITEILLKQNTAIVYIYLSILIIYIIYNGDHQPKYLQLNNQQSRTKC